MNYQIEQSLERVTSSAKDAFHSAVSGARQRGQSAALSVHESKKPLRTLSGLGLKLSAVSHRTTDRVLKQQTTLAANQLDLIAERIASAAGATCLRDLVRKQLRLTPAQLTQLRDDAKASFAVIATGGSEARDVIVDGVGALRRPAPAQPKKAPARRKPATKKTTAKKTTAKKATTRKAAAKPAKAAKKARKVSAKPKATTGKA